MKNYLLTEKDLENLGLDKDKIDSINQNKQVVFAYTRAEFEGLLLNRFATIDKSKYTIDFPELIDKIIEECFSTLEWQIEPNESLWYSLDEEIYEHFDNTINNTLKKYNLI